jgi:hypothetical protein
MKLLNEELHNSCISSAIISLMNLVRLLTPACGRGDGIVDIFFGKLGWGKMLHGRPSHEWKDIFLTEPQMNINLCLRDGFYL